MNQEFDSLRQARATINVTPLIDVLLVLLIIFMIVTPMLTQAMDTDIPQEAELSVLESYSRHQLVLTLTADGRTLLNQESLTIGQLPLRLRELLSVRGGRKLVFVNADDGLPYGHVVQMMDLCRSAGAEHVSLVLQPLMPVSSP
jgi:biopolymer transport protein ExbD